MERPVFSESISPAVLNSLRWKDKVGLGMPKARERSPAQSPSGLFLARRRNTSNRDSCASADNAMLASLSFIILE